MPCENTVLRLNRRDMHGLTNLPKFVRPGGLPGASDIKNYDVGNLFVATQGITANSEVGELHVRYTVRFEVPVLESGTTAPQNNQVSLFKQTTQAVTAAVPTVNTLSTIVTNGVVAVNTAGSIVLPPGNYLLDVDSTGNGTAVAILTVDIFKNGVSADGVAFQQTSAGGLLQQSGSKSTYVTSNGTDAFTVITTVTASGSPTVSSVLRITAI